MLESYLNRLKEKMDEITENWSNESLEQLIHEASDTEAKGLGERLYRMFFESVAAAYIIEDEVD